MKSFALALLSSALLAGPAVAQQKPEDHSAHHPGATATAATTAADMTDGEVRKVDKGAAKLTLKHGEIRNLEMPPMTMVFNVRDKAMLDQIKAGNKVRFKAVNEAGRYTVTALEVVP